MVGSRKCGRGGATRIIFMCALRARPKAPNANRNRYRPQLRAVDTNLIPGSKRRCCFLKYLP